MFVDRLYFSIDVPENTSYSFSDIYMYSLSYILEGNVKLFYSGCWILYNAIFEKIYT